MAEHYIGDGVYASMDEGMLKLRTKRDNGDHFIYLEDRVLENLLAFCQHLGLEAVRPKK